jgi:hypothetical protein
LKIQKTIRNLFFLTLILTLSLCLLSLKVNAQEQKPVLVWIEAPTEPLAIGEIFNVTIHIDNMPVLDTGTNGIGGIEFIVTWDPNIIKALSMTEVLFHTVVPEYDYDACVWQLKNEISNKKETVSAYGELPAHAWYAYAFLDVSYAVEQGYAPITGNQTLAIITFNTTAVGMTGINFVVLKIGDLNGEPLTVHGVNFYGIGAVVTAGNPPPYITIISPQNETVYATEEINLIFTLSEEASWIGYSIDGGINRTITGNTTITVAEGRHSLIIYANDTTGQMGFSDIIYFAVDKSPPVASFTYYPEKPEPKMVFGTFKWNITFDASASYDSITNIACYIWDFGDGFNLTSASPIISHVYRNSGKYSVTLTVIDAIGNYATTTKTIIIPDASPPLTIPYGLIIAIILPPAWIVALRTYLKRLKRKNLNRTKTSFH